VLFIAELVLSTTPKSESIRAPHQENVLQHLKNGERAYGAATNFCPFNFLVSALQIRLHCQEQNFNIEREPAKQLNSKSKESARVTKQE
jgi:hypothetical protein